MDITIETPGEKRERCMRLLEIRQLLGKSSTAKFSAYLNRLQSDSRIRALLMYHGAGTGRWTAKGPQLQNLPSRGLVLEAEEVDGAVRAAHLGLVSTLYDDVFGAAQSCLRGMLVPEPGHRFICADYSAIEGRVLAWAAGETGVLSGYRQGLRMYCVAAAGVFRTSYEHIEQGRHTDKACKKMDAVGKVIELACGYQGALRAFRSMERSLGMHLDMTDEEIQVNIKQWRESRSATVALWRGMEDAAFQAVESPGIVATYGPVRFKALGKFLLMKLPSGRFLYYFNPRIEPKLMPWKTDAGGDVMKDCVSYWGVDSKTKKWSKKFGYGGLWTENFVQAASRDIMANGMVLLDQAGYNPILTVHDEVLSEDLEGFGSLGEFTRILTTLPPWAAGLPVAASGWEGYRYRK